MVVSGIFGGPVFLVMIVSMKTSYLSEELSTENVSLLIFVLTWGLENNGAHFVTEDNDGLLVTLHTTR